MDSLELPVSQELADNLESAVGAGGLEPQDGRDNQDSQGKEPADGAVGQDWELDGKTSLREHISGLIPTRYSMRSTEHISGRLARVPHTGALLPSTPRLLKLVPEPTSKNQHPR